MEISSPSSVAGKKWVTSSKLNKIRLVVDLDMERGTRAVVFPCQQRLLPDSKGACH